VQVHHGISGGGGGRHIGPVVGGARTPERRGLGQFAGRGATGPASNWHGPFASGPAENSRPSEDGWMERCADRPDPPTGGSLLFLSLSLSLSRFSLALSVGASLVRREREATARTERSLPAEATEMHLFGWCLGYLCVRAPSSRSPNRRAPLALLNVRTANPRYFYSAEAKLAG
jgi:hypothetical protein